MCNRVVDMDGKGTWTAIVGRGGAYHELAVYDAVTGKLKWRHMLANRATGVTAVDLDGDGAREVVVGSASAWLCTFGLDGRPRWSARRATRT